MRSKANVSRAYLITLLFAIFLTPMLFAWLSYSQAWFLTNKTTNHGQLISPPLNLTSLEFKNEQGTLVTSSQFRGKWWLIYATDACHSNCLKNLYFMRQIHLATGKNQDRIARAILLNENFSLTPELRQQLHTEYMGMTLFKAPSSELEKLCRFDADKKLVLQRGRLYLVDPLGNIMMYYSSDTQPRGILKDLERLLKVSQIG